jgi:broad specificity phosphatase PhoE
LATRIILLTTISTLPVPPASAASSQVTTIILVRHAEKVTDNPQDQDPALSPAGQERAQELAKALDGATVSAIYVTEFRRTQLTAAPVAQRFGLTPEIRPRGTAEAGAYAQDQAPKILKKHPGKVVLIISHNDTVPAFVKVLTGKTVPEITDSEFDRFYVVEVPKTGTARLIATRYGRPRP